MNQAELAAWAAASATGLSAVIVLGQAVVQRRQGQLQEAEAHRQQAKEWAELTTSWGTAFLVALGSSAPYRFGISRAKVDAYFEAVERYRLAWTAWLKITTTLSESDWEAIVREEQAALDQLAPYRNAVEQVVLHLARVSGLVLRKRLALSAPYDAFGLEVIRAGDNLLALLRSGYDHGAGCVAPGNLERALWLQLNAEQVSERIGWGVLLDVARATAERIAMFISLLMAHAVSVGDLDGAFDTGHYQKRLVTVSMTRNAWVLFGEPHGSTGRFGLFV